MGVLHELRKSAPGTRGCRQFFSNTQWLNAKLNSFVLDPYHFYQVTFSSRVGKWTLSCWKRRIICNTFSCRTIPTEFSLHFSLKRKKWEYALDASTHCTTDQIWVPLLVPRFYSNFFSKLIIIGKLSSLLVVFYKLTKLKTYSRVINLVSI